ncbi:hypothetical protein AAFF_G00203520 [Aldrovandia affinis]|uniref:Uncharacterized protein n=1 Tax=Aldrovandia affinis TaxID=143900 RepID=A0AAD7SX76_9TELE|nr:hypothetical protein AAFF_G00203520 [Aldrovandia affinis]
MKRISVLVRLRLQATGRHPARDVLLERQTGLSFRPEMRGVPEDAPGAAPVSDGCGIEEVACREAMHYGPIFRTASGIPLPLRFALFPQSPLHSTLKYTHCH